MNSLRPSGSGPEQVLHLWASKRAHIGSMKATSNADRRDAPATKMVKLFWFGSLRAGLIIAALTATPVATTAQEGLALDISTGGAVAQGDAAVLELRCRCEPSAVSASGDLLGATLELVRGPEGAWRGLIGVDVLTAPGLYSLSITVARPGAAPFTATHPLEIAAKAFSTRELTVEPRFVEPPPDEQERLTREAVRLNALYRTVTPRSPLGPMREPLASDVTGVFGSRSVFNGQPRNPHAGVDFRGDVGTPIGAPAAGTVVMAEDLYFTGQTVVIDHGGAMYSILAHMSAIEAHVGHEVQPGDIVGAVGATGRVTGPHLHWSIRLLGARVDPLSVLRLLGQ